MQVSTRLQKLLSKRDTLDSESPDRLGHSRGKQVLREVQMVQVHVAQYSRITPFNWFSCKNWNHYFGSRQE
jgi:hypothetical protein